MLQAKSYVRRFWQTLGQGLGLGWILNKYSPKGEEGSKMADMLSSTTNVLATLWHFGACGFSFILATLLAWELVASRRKAKAEVNLQDWSSGVSASNWDRYEGSSIDLPLSANMSSDILSRISPHTARRHGN